MGVELKRGELIRSYRTIAKDCGYMIGYRLKQPSLDTVRRCCEDLTKELRIAQRTVHQGTIFTIINYNELQPIINKRTAQRRRESSYSDRTATVQDNNNKEELIIKKKESGGNGIPDWIPQETWQAYKEFRIRKKAPLTDLAVKKTIIELEKLKKSGHNTSRRVPLISMTAKLSWSMVRILPGKAIHIRIILNNVCDAKQLVYHSKSQ